MEQPTMSARLIPLTQVQRDKPHVRTWRKQTNSC
jgi:hypothetical protein